MRIILLSLAAVLAACSCPSEQPTPSAVPSSPPPPPPPAAPVDRVRGLVTLEGEAPSFTRCGGEVPMTIVGSAVDELLETMDRLGAASGAPPVAIEMIGATRLLPNGVGLASIESLQVAMPPGSASLCDLDASYLYKASGNEPFWSLTVGEGQLRFEAMALEAPVEIAATPARTPGQSGPAWRGEQDGHSLEVQLSPERCHDGMSGAAFPFRASVILDGESFVGCAMQGWTQAP